MSPNTYASIVTMIAFYASFRSYTKGRVIERLKDAAKEQGARIEIQRRTIVQDHPELETGDPHRVRSQYRHVIHLADADVIIAVMDRVPNQDDLFDPEDTPTIWLNPRLQRSWRLGMDDATGDFDWIETTLPLGEDGVLTVTGFTPNDVFFAAEALYDEGAHHRLQQINGVNLEDPNGMEIARNAIRGMHRAVCRGMDRSGDSRAWTTIHDGNDGGQVLRSDNRLHRVARAPAAWNPFAEQDRPLNLDD